MTDGERIMFRVTVDVKAVVLRPTSTRRELTPVIAGDADECLTLVGLKVEQPST